MKNNWKYFKENLERSVKAAQQISDYWRERGYDVGAYVDQNGRIITNLCNGLPKGARSSVVEWPRG